LNISNDVKITFSIFLVLFHFFFVAIPIAIGINSLLFADFAPLPTGRQVEKKKNNFVIL
jgi:hypothetical protein